MYIFFLIIITSIFINNNSLLGIVIIINLIITNKFIINCFRVFIYVYLRGVTTIWFFDDNSII